MSGLRLTLALLMTMLPQAPLLARPGVAETVRSFMKAMSEKDRETLASLIDENAVFEYPFDRSGRTEEGSWRRFQGREAVLSGYVDTAFTRIAKIAWTDEQFTTSADGSVVFVEALGDMVLSTSAVYQNRYVLRFDVRHGRVVGMKEYMNPVTAALATGASLGPSK